MKRNLIFFIITAVCLSMSMTACGGSKEKSDEKTKPDKVQTETITEEESSDIEQEKTASDQKAEKNQEENNVSSEEETSEEKYSPMDVQEEGNIDLDEDETFVIQ